MVRPAWRNASRGFLPADAGRQFGDLEPELARDRPDARGASSLAWDRAREASRDTWGRVADDHQRRST